jgi:hypothetical protein
MTSRIQSCIDHIKTSVDIDPWAAELAEKALRQYEPRVMAWDEVRAAMKAPIWKETKSMHNALYNGWVLAYDIQTGQGITGTRLGMAEPSGRVVWYKAEDYGKTWRCWTARPTDEQREATPWNP